jgi:hypothetical protein
LIGKLTYKGSGPTNLNRNSNRVPVSTVDGTTLTSYREQGLYTEEELTAQIRIGEQRRKPENNF